MHRIGKVVSRQDPHFASGQHEMRSHFLSVCTKFHDARTAAHNHVRGHLSVSVSKFLPIGWKLYEETVGPIRAVVGLLLRPVPSTQVQQSGRAVTAANQAAGSMSLGNWRPDFLVVSHWHSRRKLAILELCRPSDVCLGRLQAAYLGMLDI